MGQDEANICPIWLQNGSKMLLAASGRSLGGPLTSTRTPPTPADMMRSRATPRRDGRCGGRSLGPPRSLGLALATTRGRARFCERCRRVGGGARFVGTRLAQARPSRAKPCPECCLLHSMPTDDEFLFSSRYAPPTYLLGGLIVFIFFASP